MTDDDEQIEVRDDHPRTGAAESMHAALARVLAGGRAEEVLDHALDDADWWRARDQAVARWTAERATEKRTSERRELAATLTSDACAFPARAVDAALTSERRTTAMGHAAEYLRGRKTVLVLAGGTGAGKTSAAAWVALEAGGLSPAFVRATELEARGRYDKALRTWLRGRSMLVIDDLGVEVLDDRGVFRSLLDEIIDTFYGNKRRVVITTNLLAKRKVLGNADEEPQFLERYGERVASRLRECGRWADCGALDLRREPAQLAGVR